MCEDVIYIDPNQWDDLMEELENPEEPTETMWEIIKMSIAGQH